MFFIAETERIALIPLDESNLELVCSWWNDGRVTGPMGFPNGIGVTKENLSQRFKEQLEEKNKTLSSRMYIIYSKELKKPIGELQYGEADMNNMSCRLGIKIGDISAQGKGYGKESLICLIQYLFNKLKMKTILIDSFPENAPAYNLYKNLGFTEIEVLKNVWTDEADKSHDLVMMELKKENWLFANIEVSYN